MNKQFEYARGSRAYSLTVHYQEGERTDRGEPNVRPEAWEPDFITQVDDENGNDVTDWALDKFGSDTLLKTNFADLTKPRKQSEKPVLIYSSYKYIQPCKR